MSVENPKENADFAVVRTHAVDALIIDQLVRPLAMFVPRGITPNQITAVTPFMTSACFACAVMAPRTENRDNALLLGLLSALFCIGAMLTDHLDGMHARNTRQTSELGEILDHWVDSYSVPLLVLALPASMGATGLLVSIAVATGAMVYHTQLLVYRTTGRFIYPPTGSAASAMLLALSLTVVAVVQRFLPDDEFIRSSFITLVLALMTLGQVLNIRYYFRSLEKERLLSAYFFGGYCLVALMYALNLVGIWPATLLWIALSFRNSGSLVLFTVKKVEHRGFDPALLFMLLMMPFLLVSPLPMLPLNMEWGFLLSVCVTLYASIANLRDFLRLT